MFNLGLGELAIILIVLLVVVGPSRLPTLMKSVGKTMRTLRQASRDIRTSIGFDELMREDVLRVPPRPRAVPPQTEPRLPHATAPVADGAVPEAAPKADAPVGGEHEAEPPTRPGKDG